jgi:hypothetical protein
MSATYNLRARKPKDPMASHPPAPQNRQLRPLPNFIFMTRWL